MCPNALVIGVEPENVASYAAAIKAGHPVNGFKGATLADGLAVPIVGMFPLYLYKQFVAQSLSVINLLLRSE
jgi:threonine dehydratase